MISPRPFRIFVGYDRHEIVAYHAFCESVIGASSVPVSFVPLALDMLGDIYRRPRHELQSTDFSFSRFLVPYLSGYEGWSLFVDCDIMLRTDIARLVALADPDCALMVCQHDYVPADERKFLGNVQTRYARKNWSSVMLFNNALCRALTPDYVNSATGLELHQFKWLRDDERIGALPLSWNWLVGEYAHDPAADMVHFTVGGPYFDEYAECDFADEWRAVHARMNSVVQRAKK